MKGTKKIIRYVWRNQVSYFMKILKHSFIYNDFAHYTDINCTSTAASADGNKKSYESWGI